MRLQGNLKTFTAHDLPNPMDKARREAEEQSWHFCSSPLFRGNSVATEHDTCVIDFSLGAALRCHHIQEREMRCRKAIRETLVPEITFQIVSLYLLVK